MNISRAMFLAAVVAAVLTPACTRTVVYQERNPKPVVVTDEHHGPPPHAPANGYRYKHSKDNVTLVYDAGIDVYVVSGYKDCYYSAGQYFRLVKSSWEWSVTIEGQWKVVSHSSDVPSGLRHKHGHGNDHGKGHDKHHDEDDD